MAGLPPITEGGSHVRVQLPCVLHWGCDSLVQGMHGQQHAMQACCALCVVVAGLGGACGQAGRSTLPSLAVGHVTIRDMALGRGAAMSVCGSCRNLRPKWSKTNRVSALLPSRLDTGHGQGLQGRGRSGSFTASCSGQGHQSSTQEPYPEPRWLAWQRRQPWTGPELQPRWGPPGGCPCHAR